MVEVTLATQTWQGKTYQNIEWVNEPGHSAKHSGGKITESGDKAAIMAKYGAKFKAAFGGKPKAMHPASARFAAPASPSGDMTAKKPAPAATPKAAPVAKAPPAKTRPAPKAPPAKAEAAYPDGMDGANKVWDEFSTANESMPQAELQERWFAAIDRHSDGKDQQDMTGEQWALVAADLADGDMHF